VTSSTHRRELLLRYFLREMDPSEREKVDTQLIADPEFSADFQETQDDLLDDFAADRLPAEEAARVQRAIEANAAFARAAQMANAFRLVNWHPRPDTKRVSRFRLPYWAVAACGIMIVAGVGASVLWLHRPAAPLAQLKDAPASVATIIRPQTPAGSSTGVSAQPMPQASPKRAMLVATLVLPEGVRSAVSIPLHLQQSVQNLHIEWPVPVEAEKSRHLVLTILQDSKQVAQSTEESPRRTIAGTPVARFAVPATQLLPGKYIFRVTVSGDDSGQTPLIESDVEVTRG
jgi:hypothetical protein